MKLQRLCAILDQSPKTKIYLVSAQSCLCGYVSRPQPADEGVRVELGASVRMAFSSMEPVVERVGTGTLLLTEEHKVTRRLQTHRRHLTDHDVPEVYFEHAKSI